MTPDRTHPRQATPALTPPRQPRRTPPAAVTTPETAGAKAARRAVSEGGDRGPARPATRAEPADSRSTGARPVRSSSPTGLETERRSRSHRVPTGFGFASPAAAGGNILGRCAFASWASRAWSPARCAGGLRSLRAGRRSLGQSCLQDEDCLSGNCSQQHVRLGPAAARRVEAEAETRRSTRSSERRPGDASTDAMPTASPEPMRRVDGVSDAVPDGSADVRRPTSAPRTSAPRPTRRPTAPRRRRGG